MDLMHRKGFFHRDLKPDNVLMLKETDMKVCIADLGLACKASDKKQLLMKCGTPGYVDPDVLRGFPYTEKSDIFSLGCLFYNILTGRHLFHGKDNKQLLLNN